MKFSYFEIDIEHRTINNANLEAQSKFAEISKEFLTDPNGEIIVFFANYLCSLELEFLRELITQERNMASLSPEGNIKIIEPKRNDRIGVLPILILYSSDCFGTVKDKRNSGIKYWDSSIWQRWVDIGPLHKPSPKQVSNYKKSLRQVLTQIQWNMNFKWTSEKDSYVNIYENEAVAKEFCEFNTRLYQNSFIANFGKNDKDGHAGEIIPFPFFEESEFYKKSKELPLFKNEKFAIKWRILVIDDKPERKKHLTELLSSGFFGGKFKILDREDEELNEKDLRPALFFKQIKKFDDVEKELENTHYDIILLDYLLDETAGKSRNFSVDLFPNRNNDEEDYSVFNNKMIKRGPNNKLWIFLTSCHSLAFLENLREQGVSLNDENWIINRGADPINTPNAFVYTFSRFLEYQFFNFSGKEESSDFIWTEALAELGDKKTFTRDWANSTLAKILDYTNNIRSLDKISYPKGVKSIKNGSLFAASFSTSEWYRKEISERFTSGWYGYLTHLLFSLSFGDGNNWEELKNDLEFVRHKNQFIEIDLIKQGYEEIQAQIEKLRKAYGS